MPWLLVCSLYRITLSQYLLKIGCLPWKEQEDGWALRKHCEETPQAAPWRRHEQDLREAVVRTQRYLASQNIHTLFTKSKRAREYFL
jgi:hypothetical protein